MCVCVAMYICGTAVVVNVTTYLVKVLRLDLSKSLEDLSKHDEFYQNTKDFNVKS